MKAFFTAVLIVFSLSLHAQAPLLPPGPQLLPDSGLRVESVTGTAPAPRFPANREGRLISRSLLVLGGSSAAGLITYEFVDEPLREFTLLHRNAVSGKVAAVLQPLGRSGYMLPAGGLVYASGLALRNPKLQRTGVLLVSSMLINDLVTSKLKDEFQRRRPDEANHNSYFEGGEGGRHHASFPSAHTSTAFTFATAVATVYHDHKWVPPVAYSMATLVGLSRIHDNKHWATDVLAGATVGFITAKTTNLLLKQVEKQLGRKKVNIYLLPRVANGSAGLSFGGSF